MMHHYPSDGHAFRRCVTEKRQRENDRGGQLRRLWLGPVCNVPVSPRFYRHLVLHHVDRLTSEKPIGGHAYVSIVNKYLPKVGQDKFSKTNWIAYGCLRGYRIIGVFHHNAVHNASASLIRHP